ncbi:hypothetical protein [Pseudoalteromonas umbrosa]|uniref:hypothetical protein n=1 Tax=Pseudoalteromonas umbrosa TaxID=3048489 RepID=UPI0024C33FAD|nr:hypothetical protein [Pseudoalteromonas sp. B95]
MDQQSADFVVKVASFKQVITTFSMAIIAFSRWSFSTLSAKLYSIQSQTMTSIQTCRKHCEQHHKVAKNDK